jgi:hypothetical protein
VTPAVRKALTEIAAGRALYGSAAEAGWTAVAAELAEHVGAATDSIGSAGAGTSSYVGERFRLTEAGRFALLRRPCPYGDVIRPILARLGRPEIDPRHIEALMRTEHPTLDGLTAAAFEREVALCIKCVDEAAPGEIEAIAESHGL